MAKWGLGDHQLIVVMMKVISRGGHSAHRLSWQCLYVVSSPLQSLRALVESREELETNSDENNKLITSCICGHHYSYQSLKYCCLWTEWNWTACTVLYYCFPILCVASRYCSCIKCYVLGTTIAFSECLHITCFNGVHICWNTESAAETIILQFGYAMNLSLL